MKKKIEQFLIRYNLTNEDKTLIVGFSGGYDSMSLLHILYELSKIYGFNVVAVHLNHNWRGEEAVKDYTKGQEIEAKIIDVDVEKERISLGIKQLSEDSVNMALANIKKGDVVKAVVKEIDAKGITVEVDGLTAMIKKADLSKEKSLQNPENFKEGDMVEAKVTSVDKKNVKIGLSIKALEVEEEKKVLEEYSNNTGGSSLGDALGEALKKAN